MKKLPDPDFTFACDSSEISCLHFANFASKQLLFVGTSDAKLVAFNLATKKQWNCLSVDDLKSNLTKTILVSCGSFENFLWIQLRFSGVKIYKFEDSNEKFIFEAEIPMINSGFCPVAQLRNFLAVPQENRIEIFQIPNFVELKSEINMKKNNIGKLTDMQFFGENEFVFGTENGEILYCVNGSIIFRRLRYRNLLFSHEKNLFSHEKNLFSNDLFQFFH